MKLKYLTVLLVVSFLFINDTFGQEEVVVEQEEEQEEKSVKEKPDKVKYIRPTVKDIYHLLETFEEASQLGRKWIKSKAKKDGVEDSIAKYNGEWAIESALENFMEGDLGLVLKSKAKHHAISTSLRHPFLFSNNKPLVVQYEVKFQTPLECGGAYAKLISTEPKSSLEEFHDKTGFSIMFGPDKCGTDTKFHFIVRFKHPQTGAFEEKHAKKSQIPDNIFSDGKTHLYTLVVKPDNTFHMYIDQLEVNSGSLLKDLSPPINPDKEIVDPNDVKPESWDEREKIPDPDATKPSDWDETEPLTIPDPNAFVPEGWLENEPETIPDPNAVKPADWDEETDGVWEAPKIENPECKSAPGCGKWEPPQINNPKYKGKWKAPLIDNVNYQGKWAPRKIPNPDFFEDSNPFVSLTPFSSMGLELWSMTENILFDNFIITDDESVAEQLAKDTWALKKTVEYSKSSDESGNVFNVLINAANDKPWLWIIYILVVLLPFVLIAVFCFGKSSDKTSAKESSKKTDEVTPDDNEGEQDQEEQEDEKAEEDDDIENVNDEELEEAKKLTKSDLENNEDDSTTKKTSPMKRRPRKD